MNELESASLDGIETSLRELYEHAPCGYLSTTLDGVIVRVNETFIRWSGYRREELLGAPITSILSTGGQLFYETRYLPVLHLQGEAREVALALQHASGDTVPILVNGVVIDDAEGRPAAIRTAVFEYGGRKEYERELLDARRAAEASESRLRLVHQASKDFSAADTDERLAEELAGSAREAFAAPEVAIHLLDAEGRLVLAGGASPLATPLIASGGMVESVMQGQDVVVFGTTDAASSLAPEVTEAMRAARVESMAIVPMSDHEKPLGAFVMFFRRARTLDRNDTDLAMTFARQAAEVLTRLRVERLLERVPFYDELTGLATRRLIRVRVNEAIDDVNESRRPMALISVDLNGFRSIKDTFGRVAGDEAVMEIVGRLTGSVRDGDLVGRFGGDEFVIVCSDVNRETLDEMVDRLLIALPRPLQAGGGEGSITCNIGVAVHSGRDGLRPSSQAVFERADAAMYRAKSLGENRAAIVAMDAAS